VASPGRTISIPRTLRIILVSCFMSLIGLVPWLVWQPQGSDGGPGGHSPALPISVDGRAPLDVSKPSRPSLSRRNMPNPERATSTVADNFLYLLVEMEGCLDRMDTAVWTREQREKIELRLFDLAARIAWKGQ
jgi:hypothetical protein